MVSRRFLAWVGVGLLGVVTIPALAAPHLARLVARKPAVAKVKEPKAKRAVVKAAPATKPATRPVEAAVAGKGPEGKGRRVAKVVAVEAKVRRRAPKPVVAAVAKPVASAPSVTATARKLLH